MSRSLLQLVLRHADGLATGPDVEPDADLLRRFVRTRDEAAFADLVRRHGPMVWAVCRHLLPDHADAEDAFQATFLALVRSAGSVRQGNAVAGWLHGVAVRVATKVKRAAVRRRQREHKAAGPEADRSVPAATWDALLAAVHEEVQRLPDPLRVAFVLCDLEGVRQPDAAARLGWKAGTLTGRLARARQVLLARLAGRGLAPALAGGTVGLGMATAAAAVPAGLTEKVMTLTAAGGVVPPAILKLVREVTPMALNRTKLAAAVLLMTGGLGTVLYPVAVAQQPGGGGGSGGFGSPSGAAPATPPRPGTTGGGIMGLPPGPSGGSGFSGIGRPPPGSRGGGSGFGGGGIMGTPPTGGEGGFTPGMGPGGMPGTGGMMSAGGAGRAVWEHAIVTRPDTLSGFQKLLDARGKDGWEFAGAVEFGSALTDTQLVFKRPRGGARAMGGGMGMPGGMPAMGPMGGPDAGGGAPPNDDASFLRRTYLDLLGMPPTADDTRRFLADTDPGKREKVVARLRGPGASAPMGGGAAPGKPGFQQITVVTLKNAEAEALTTVLEMVFPGDVAVTPDRRTNSLIIRANEATMKELRTLIERLDEPDGKPPGGGKSPTGGGRPARP